MTKNETFASIRELIIAKGFYISSEDSSRPWGGFFVIDEAQAPAFTQFFFPDADIPPGKISPKILLVEPGKKLSWQYHLRRSERWICLAGNPQIVRSMTDLQTPPQDFKTGEEIVFSRTERHRLIAGNEWAVVAEIWIHSDPDNPSNEDDIIRLQDDFGRDNLN